jgi:cytoskeletal protein CcmA (bactofilin family)
MQKTIFLGLILMLFLPISASAETVVRTGQNITVEAEQTVAGDYYVYVGPFSNTTMSGKVEGDMYAFGGVVTTNGAIENDLTIIGGSAQMHATVTDDVRIVAGEVTVADHVGGDLVVLGGVLNVLSTATIDGDVIFYGGTATIAGSIKGSVLGTAEKVRIDATVQKNVDVQTAKALTLGDTANIAGAVRYTSIYELERGVNAEIAGEVTKVNSVSATANTKHGLTLFSLLPMLISLFSTLVLFLLFRRTLEAVALRVQKHTLKVSLLGMGALLLGPSIAVLLMVTGLGFFIGVMLLALLCFVFVLGYTLSGVVLGSYLAKWFTNHPRVTLNWVVAGTVVIQAMLFVPVVGILLAVFVSVLTIGALIFVLGLGALSN